LEGRLQKRNDRFELIVTTNYPFFVDYRVWLNEISIDENR